MKAATCMSKVKVNSEKYKVEQTNGLLMSVRFFLIYDLVYWERQYVFSIIIKRDTIKTGAERTVLCFGTRL